MIEWELFIFKSNLNPRKANTLLSSQLEILCRDVGVHSGIGLSVISDGNHVYSALNWIMCCKYIPIQRSDEILKH